MTYPTYPHLRSRIAAIGVRQADIAIQMEMHESLFSAILNGRRRAPADFEDRVLATLSRLEAAERAAQEARARVLAESESSSRE